MTINAGVWIDHHKAVVVLLAGDREDVRQIMSGRDQPARSAGGTRVRKSFTPNDFVADDKRERKAMIDLNKYYDEVIACLRDADTVLVLGPGEAKGEFIKRVAEHKLKRRIAQVETVDRMTDREVAAHVRQHYGLVPKRKNRQVQE